MAEKRKQSQSKAPSWDVAKTVSAVLEAETLQGAAKALSVNYSTLWRRMQTPEFRRAYLEARRQIVTQSVARLQGATGEAVEALRTVLADPNEGGNVKVQAARAVLSHALQAVELEDLEQRVSELEEK